ncbi:GIY-YIG nuclease family protein [Butyricicoccus faecihominis]|uniref:GIY-YIG nuclease family protein n=1 Tax=Butyricicoccus faecihominis TaxID=1712515 RepID=UPI002479C4D5|nr:GIY-YIG nuclease family protein [Butyricicoccus faecihominis]MCQ5131382.1 GIY-YIG nuclease family protein [Butyricicoccus faecihominis]
MEKQDRRDAIAAYKARKNEGGVFCIRNTVTGRALLNWAVDLKGSENRFAFAQMTDLCADNALRDDWKQYGCKAFAFEVLESIKQKETQTDKEFRDDVQTLYALWQEKLADQELY